MAQATNSSTTSLSHFHNSADPTPTRRAFLHTIAALPIAAVAPSATAHTLDADLVELGARFEPLVDQYYVARKRWAPLTLAAHAECDREGQYLREAFEDIYERSGANEALDALSAIRQELEELANAINAASTNSIAGLRAKAMVALWRVDPLRADDTEFSFEAPCSFQHLFTAVAELCGLKDKMAATGYRLPDITMVDDDDFRWSEPA
jgi:hypothetical protein